MKSLLKCIFGVAVSGYSLIQAANLTPHLSFQSGPINSVKVESESGMIMVYAPHRQTGDSKPGMALLTHGRRDVVSPARQFPNGTPMTAPEAERGWLENPQAYWDEFTTKRFHDYDQQTTKVNATSLPVTRWVKDGDTIEWHGLKCSVIETPGYTRGAVSYLTEIDDKKIIFTGDLIFGDGKLIDLYSLQDAIPEANVRGYHGYAGRLGALVSSLKKIKALEPDMLIPARGPVIETPTQSIDKLIARVQSVYKNYLSTNALNWYFKEDRMRLCGERVLGSKEAVELMPYSVHVQTPEWIKGFSTSRLIISKDGFAFLLDCGNQRVIDEVQNLITSGLIEKVEGIFVTHIHDDHTDMVQKAADTFHCPVYATNEYADVLKQPGAYHIPALTANAIPEIISMKDGTEMAWREFEFTFHFYPGQTYYHGALLVQKPGEDPIFFVGDSFAPSGLDDYCLLNRNLMHEDTGYFRCMRMLREMPDNTWLINEHIPYIFRFSREELDYLESRYRDRASTLDELFPWDDLNYGIDEQWAVFYPYGMDTTPDQTQKLEVRITNHSPKERTFTVTPRGWNGLEVLSKEGRLTIPSRETMTLSVTVKTPTNPGNYLVTADVASDSVKLHDWIEALITVK